MPKLSPQLREDLKDFIKARMEHKGVYAQIAAPYELGDDEIQAIRQRFPLLHDAQITTHLDPSLLGGFVITVGSRLIDCSIKNHIRTVFSI